jgi:type I restriction enzyme S subunit
VEWIGDIPEYWFCQRLKGLFREIDERSLSGAEQHLSMSQKHGGLVKSSEIEERRLMSESYAGGKLCASDDIILNRLKAHLGVFALAPCDGVISPDYSVFRGLTEIEPLYFEYLLRSTTIRPELRMRCKGIVEGFWRLYSDDFLALKVPVPPIDEQREIIKEISSCSIAIDKATVRAKDEIDLIREYRARLISDVVTGQVDVRHIAIPEIAGEDLTPLDEDDTDAEDLLDETLEAEDAA